MNAAEDEPFEHWCEVCGRTEMLTSRQAYDAGWDFPPMMGVFGVISGRQCPSVECTIEKTAWWALAVEKTPVDDLPARHLVTVMRILAETGAGNA
ncbi:hypothetical protein [Demequina sp. NBRC 110054]|uniref:hypothetical protein n=1 Tax=Demequina sp. NBRC 110054 TaxID=1570343 RepID=UPI000A022CC5|nr:hypothetical protein [Demequina sp. NBRC 110054]